MAFLLPLIFAAGCHAAAAATGPTGLEATARIVCKQNIWTAEIVFTNPTDHPLATGPLATFTVTRTDITPPTVVAASPEHAASPHFRVVISPHESRATTMTLWDKTEPLPAGTYRLIVTYPPDILPQKIEEEFTVSPSSTAPSNP